MHNFVHDIVVVQSVNDAEILNELWINSKVKNHFVFQMT